MEIQGAVGPTRSSGREWLLSRLALPTRFDHRLLWIVIINGLIFNGVLTCASFLMLYMKWFELAGTVGTSFGPLFHSLLPMRQGHDSWAPMLIALKCYKDKLPIYQTVFFTDKIKFQYPLSSLLPLYVLERWGWSNEGIFRFLNLFSWLAFWTTLVVSVRLLICSVQNSPSSDKGSRSDSRTFFVATVIAGLLFYPLLRGYALGQVQIFLCLLFVISLESWLDNRYVASGVLWGLMCLIKPQYGLMLVWFALRRKFSSLAAGAFTLAAGICLTGFVFGWHEQFQYLNVLRFIGAHGESYWRNESVNGLLNHLFFNGTNLDWEAHSFAPHQSVIYALTVITSLVIVGLAWFWPFSIQERAGPIDFAAMAISATVASPVAWEHHYGILFPIFAMLAGRTGRARNGKLLVLAYVLVANGWGPLNILAGVPVLNALQSMRLFGVILLLGLLYTWNPNLPFDRISPSA